MKTIRSGSLSGEQAAAHTHHHYMVNHKLLTYFIYLLAIYMHQTTDYFYKYCGMVQIIIMREIEKIHKALPTSSSCRFCSSAFLLASCAIFLSTSFCFSISSIFFLSSSIFLSNSICFSFCLFFSCSATKSAQSTYNVASAQSTYNVASAQSTYNVASVQSTDNVALAQKNDMHQSRTPSNA